MKIFLNNCAVIAVVLFVISCKQPTMEDIDGNVYRTVKIGKQTWMAENLRVTRYRNGNPIFHVPEAEKWSRISDGAYCGYANDSANATKYGRLYNWYAIADVRNLAPEGWRIPTSEDLQILLEHLKGDTTAGGKLKAVGSNFWLDPNAGATNESGFNALPAGYRYGNEGSFHVMKTSGYWWTTTQSFELHSWSPRFYNTFADVVRDTLYMKYGLSVRCIKE